MKEIVYVISWDWNPEYRIGPGLGNYVGTKRSRPYHYNDPWHKDVKTWKTYRAAEKWLSLKDPGFARQCRIECRQ